MLNRRFFSAEADILKRLKFTKDMDKAVTTLHKSLKNINIKRALYLLPILMLHVAGLTTGSWFKVSYQKGIQPRTRSIGLLNVCEGGDFFFIDAKSDCHNADSRHQHYLGVHYEASKKILWFGAVLLVIATSLRVVVTSDMQENRHYRAKYWKNTCTFAGIVILTGVVWSFLTFRSDINRYYMYKAFLETSHGFSFYLSTLSGILALVLTTLVHKIKIQ